jgi:hypothetical protein
MPGSEDTHVLSEIDRIKIILHNLICMRPWVPSPSPPTLQNIESFCCPLSFSRLTKTCLSNCFTTSFSLCQSAKSKIWANFNVGLKLSFCQILSVLVIKPRVSSMLGKCSTLSYTTKPNELILPPSSLSLETHCVVLQESLSNSTGASQRTCLFTSISFRFFHIS